MYDARSRSVCVRFYFLGFWVMQIVVEENKIHENNKKKKKQTRFVSRMHHYGLKHTQMRHALFAYTHKLLQLCVDMISVAKTDAMAMDKQHHRAHFVCSGRQASQFYTHKLINTNTPPLSAENFQRILPIIIYVHAFPPRRDRWNALL